MTLLTRPRQVAGTQPDQALAELLATEQVQNPYRFAGYYYDHATELYKAGHRYYDPKSASWTQKDPINQVASPNEGNPYVYVGADPVNNTDPSGLFLSYQEAAIAIGTAGVGTAGCAVAAVAAGVPTAEVASAPFFGLCVGAVDGVGIVALGADIADDDDGVPSFIPFA